jgi:cytochrome oxidase Cu insertion factor (SCO1/SenC/PrrC family)
MWVQTGAYHLSGLYWLIALIVVFVIALVAIIVAGRALSQGRAAMRARRDNRGCPEPGLKTRSYRNPSGCWTSGTPKER